MKKKKKIHAKYRWISQTRNGPVYWKSILNIYIFFFVAFKETFIKTMKKPREKERKTDNRFCVL